MLTKVFIRSADKEALTSHPLWSQIMELFLVEGAVSVVEVELMSEETNHDAEHDLASAVVRD